MGRLFPKPASCGVFWFVETAVPPVLAIAFGRIWSLDHNYRIIIVNLALGTRISNHPIEERG